MEFSNLNLVKTGDEKQWYMTIEEVAKGYGVKRTTVMDHLRNHNDEIRVGIERGVENTDTLGGLQETTVLYREGVIKLGFFVRSKQAKAFRQWATELVCEHMDRKGMGLPEMFERLNSKLDETTSKLDGLTEKVDSIQDEIDELRSIVRMMFTETDEKEIRGLIRRIKNEKEMDGRAIVGHVRKTLNVGSIYSTPDTKQIINVLKNLLGIGLKLL